MKEAIAGFILGVIFTLFVLPLIPGLIIKDYHDSKNKCEESLPRNQICVMYFKPE